MKKSISLINLAEKIQKFSSVNGGVFDFFDLSNLIQSGDFFQNQRWLKRLIQEKLLYRIQRNLFASPKANPWLLACRLKKKSYISMDSVLARNGLIGTTPEFSISLVYPGRKFSLETHFGKLNYYSIDERLFFGFEREPLGVFVADNEKAYLDLLYFYTKGARFAIDPLQEVNLAKLNRKKILTYLKSYQNPKFVKFVKGVLS